MSTLSNNRAPLNSSHLKEHCQTNEYNNKHIPSNKGHMANTLEKPLLEYCPKATSKKTSEFPRIEVKRMYNHRKLPKISFCLGGNGLFTIYMPLPWRSSSLGKRHKQGKLKQNAKALKKNSFLLVHRSLSSDTCEVDYF